MTYVKRIDGDKVVSLITYDYIPVFSGDTSMIIITEEEYNTLREEMRAFQAKPDPDVIDDIEALAIITGEVDADETQ